MSKSRPELLEDGQQEGQGGKGRGVRTAQSRRNRAMSRGRQSKRWVDSWDRLREGRWRWGKNLGWEKSLNSPTAGGFALGLGSRAWLSPRKSGYTGGINVLLDIHPQHRVWNLPVLGLHAHWKYSFIQSASSELSCCWPDTVLSPREMISTPALRVLPGHGSKTGYIFSISPQFLEEYSLQNGQFHNYC